MSEQQSTKTGTISWHDLTVENAEEVRDFYSQVVGWEAAAVPMDNGTYNDFCMNLPGTSETQAGVCHARGSNSKIPPQWIMYVGVEDAAASAQRCLQLGGEIIDGPREMDGVNYYYLKDPAGATIAIYS